MSRLFLSEAEGVDKGFYTLRLLYGIEVLTLQILDKSKHTLLFVGHLANSNGNFIKPRKPCRAEATLACDKTVAAVGHRSYQKRLQNPMLSYAVGEL